MEKIDKIIENYNRKKSINVLLVDLIYLLIFSIIIFINIILFEALFFMTLKNKILVVSFLIPLIFSLLLYILLKFIIQYFLLLKANNKYNIAKEIGIEFGNIKDQLLNILQIHHQKNKNNLDLKNYAAKKLTKKLNKIADSKISFTIPDLSLKLILILIPMFIVFLLNESLYNSAYRILRYKTNFTPPYPFTLESESKNVDKLSSDALNIKINGSGSLPDSIIFNWIENDTQHKQKIALKKTSYDFNFENLSSDIIYWADYENKHFFSKWDKITTDKYLINVKQRPFIENITFEITPPLYTQEKSTIYKLTNNNQINLLKGSKIQVDATTNNELQEAWVSTSKDRINLYTDKNNINGDLHITDDMIFKIHFLDKNFIPNLSIKQYNLNVKYDLKPNIAIQKPSDIFTIDESMTIPIVANINDDYGLKEVYIEYEIVSSDFPESNNKKNKIILNSPDSLGKSLNINMNWDIDNITILMGDELHFKIIAKDNNEIDGYQISESSLLIGKFPDIVDLFSELDDIEFETEQMIDDIESSLEEISDIAEELKMELLKSDETSWEQEKKIEETFDEINNINNQIEEIQKNIDKILEKAENNQLFDNELIDKFEKFQDLLSNMMSEELFDAINSLQDALQNLDMDKITEALDNYNFNIEQFEEQMDRFIEMFETAMAEQKLNELSEHMENIIEKQDALINEIKNNQDEYVLNRKSNKQEQRYQDFQELLNETSKSLESINQNTSSNLNDLASNPIIEETGSMLNNQTKNIGSNECQQDAEMAKNNMNDISEMISEVSKQFQNEITQKLTKEFIIIIDNLLTVTNFQEEIIKKSKTVRSNSPKIKTINREQDIVNRQLNQISKQLIDLSNNTFFINPQINRFIGKLKTSISNAISNFEQKKISSGKKSQKETLINLNTITLLLLLSMEEMQNSESASGYEKFMESLEKMSNQQQGINQGTMQLGQFGMMQQKSMMQQLLEQQQQLQQQLEQLIGDNPGQETGGLIKANEEMEEVIFDFKNNNVSRKTHERQQQILSKMLDSQKSLTKKDFSNKRKSKIADNYQISNINQIPTNYGEKDLFYIQAMEKALDENISTEYENITRIYFLNLQEKALNESNK